MACLEGMLNKEEMQQSLSVESRKWEDLNVDLLQKIFNGVPFSDLCDNISLVCHSWRLGSLHTIFPMDPMGGVDESKRLMRLLKTIMEGADGYECSLEQWGSSVRKIDIPATVEISDKQLLYLAERTVAVEKLFIWNCSMITSEGFGNALSNWKNVNSLFLEEVKFQYVTQILQEINRNNFSFGWLVVWHRESGLERDNVHGIVKHLCSEVKMIMKVEHYSISDDGFVISFGSGSFGEKMCVSKDDEASKIAYSLLRSFTLRITLTSGGMKT